MATTALRLCAPAVTGHLLRLSLLRLSMSFGDIVDPSTMLREGRSQIARTGPASPPHMEGGAGVSMLIRIILGWRGVRSRFRADADDHIDPADLGTGGRGPPDGGPKPLPRARPQHSRAHS